MSIDPIVRRCPTCRSIAHVKATVIKAPQHFAGCTDLALPYDVWEPVPELDARPCLGLGQWRAVHSVIGDLLDALPEDIRERLPERLQPLRFSDLEDAVIDGLVVISTRPVGDDVRLVAFGIRPRHDDDDVAWLGTAAPQEIGTTSEALIAEEGLRLDLALNRARSEGAA